MPLAAVSWLALAPGSAAGLGGPTGGTSVFAPLSTHAEEIHRYSLFVLGVTGAIFLVVFTLLAVAVVRFRRRPGDDDAEPPQIYGSLQVEVAWTVIPVLIVIVLGLTTARTIFQIQDRPEAARRPGGHGHRPAVVVGAPLSLARDRDGQRAAPAGQRLRPIPRPRF